jgi:hypothetical protein
MMNLKKLVGSSLLLAGLASCGRSGQSGAASINVERVENDAKAPFEFEPLGYDATQARHLDLIAKSSLALDAEERALLAKNGFVISERLKRHTFAHGYAEIYKQDLPVYISADSILEAVHRSFDAILKQLEVNVIVPEFATLLDNMRSKLSAGAAQSFGAQTERDVDEYLAVAAALLEDAGPDLVRGGDVARVEKIVALARSASGAGQLQLFGRTRPEDYSQFKPRGHYEGNAALEKYFRAMMWFGRVDLRPIDVDSHGKVELERREVAGMLALRALVDDADMKRFKAIDRGIAAFTGERDSMSFGELDRMLREMGARSPVAAQQLSDDVWVRTFEQHDYGKQRIASHLRGNQTKGTLPGARSFSPFGQRFIVDSEVFSNLVYDRVLHAQKPKRMMPDPLDVGYAVFDNAQAKSLLQPQIGLYGYGRELEAARQLVESNAKPFWNANLYNLWLSSLRSLSPGRSDPDGLPAVAKTEAWGRRILNTQLASWAQLRHDTILYAKQSYTMGVITCEFPDAYVDPYPEFYARLQNFAQSGRELSEYVRSIDGRKQYIADRLQAYFEHLATVSGTLKGMAEKQRVGEEFSSEQMKFVNDTVAIKVRSLGGGGCGGGGSEPYLTGWYAGLFYDQNGILEFDPTIADVHTQSTDELGNPVGRVLHVATGAPRLIVVTVDTCKGPSSYVGQVFAYHEEITSNFERYTDSEWEQVVHQKHSPRWQTDLIAHK